MSKYYNNYKCVLFCVVCGVCRLCDRELSWLCVSAPVFLLSSKHHFLFTQKRAHSFTHPLKIFFFNMAPKGLGVESSQLFWRFYQKNAESALLWRFCGYGKNGYWCTVRMFFCPTAVMASMNLVDFDRIFLYYFFSFLKTISNISKIQSSNYQYIIKQVYIPFIPS